MFTHYSHYPPTTPPSSSYLDPAIIRPGEPVYEGPEDTDSERSDTPYRSRRKKSTGGRRRTPGPMITPAYPTASSSALKLDSRQLPPHHTYLPSTDHLYLTSPLTYREPFASVPIPKPSSPLKYRTDQDAGSGSGEPATPGLESDRTDSVVLPPRRMVDMNMAVSGSEAAQAGINTPLAAYAAQTVTWLWFGASSAPVDPSSLLLSSPNPFDHNAASSSTLNPHQVTSSTQFSEFVANMLKITMVSHSVTLVALLYIYRLKQRNPIKAEPGSEQRPFVASLILGNKYLDDNTYTNQTWSELAGLPLAEINRMEAEFLRGLDYKLGVQVEEYNQWRVLLDGFILARQREAAEITSYPHMHSHLSRTRPSIPLSPQLLQTPPLAIPSGSLQPSFYLPTRSRARSTSPQTWSPPTQPAPSFFPLSPALSRKRSAVDAFSTEMTQTGIYESLRHPPRRAGRAAFQNGTLSYVASPIRQVSGGLGRSSSLNRRIARLPDSRRGSFGHAHSTSAGTIDYIHLETYEGFSSASAYASPGPSHTIHLAHPLTPSGTHFYAPGHMTAPPSGMGTPESDLRHTVTIGQATRNAHAAWQAAQVPSHLSVGGEIIEDDYAVEDGWDSLVAPYHRSSHDGVVPPEHLMFYALAAEAHPGQDGAPRKAILRYQQPLPIPPQHAQMFPGYTFGQPYAQAPGMQVDIPGQGYPLPPDMRHYTTHGHPHTLTHGYAHPEPAQFANAGPPGYIYDPTLQPSVGLGFGFHPAYEHPQGQGHAQIQGQIVGDEMQGVENQWSSRGEWRTRSEWSSPMPGQEWR